MNSNDDRYLEIVLGPIRACRLYQPRFGHGSGYSLAEFQELYGADPFYSWFGLDSELLYAAHRAAGGITSVYRQIGIGCQRLFQQVIMDHLGLTPGQSAWSYRVKTRGGKGRALALDARIELEAVSSRQRRAELIRWLRAASKTMGVSPALQRILKGCVFEVRQGYKSKDSKRQQADLANASAAYAATYLPVLLILSTQIDEDVAERYRRARWLILRGTISGSPLTSTYSFCREVIGYDLAAFFQHHSVTLKTEIEAILTGLLS